MIHNLFYMNKNTNSNELFFSVNVENNKFVPFTEGQYSGYLIRLIWHTKENMINNEYPEDELSTVESYIYGYKILKSSDNEILFMSNKFNRNILVKLINNTVKTYSTINNKPVELINMYCHINGSFENVTITNILKYNKILEYMIIRGKDNDGNIIEEKIMNN